MQQAHTLDFATLKCHELVNIEVSTQLPGCTVNAEQ